jgi:hypothetical protein
MEKLRNFAQKSYQHENEGIFSFYHPLRYILRAKVLVSKTL